MDENVEYEERESEFDVEDEDRSEVDNNEQLGEEDFDVDVETAELPAAFCSRFQKKISLKKMFQASIGTRLS